VLISRSSDNGLNVFVSANAWLDVLVLGRVGGWNVVLGSVGVDAGAGGGSDTGQENNDGGVHVEVLGL